MEEPSFPHFEDEKLNFNCLRGECSNPCCGPLAGASDNLESFYGVPFDEFLLTPEDADSIRGYIESQRFRSILESLMGGPFNEILLTAEDANHIRRYIGSERFETLVVKQGEAGEEEHTVKYKENMCCPFWKDNGECEIDPVKPAGCRSFPLYIDESVGLCITKTCPGVGQGWTGPEETQHMIDAASEARIHFKKYLTRRLRRG